MKKKLRNFHESFNINYSSSNVNSIASYKVERTQLCVKEVKRRKDFKGKFSPPHYNTAQAVLFKYKFHEILPFL